MYRKPRPDVIKILAEEGLNAMDGAGVDDISSEEVLSACFTLTSNVCRVILTECSSEELEHNVDQIQNAIGSLFALLPERTKH